MKQGKNNKTMRLVSQRTSLFHYTTFLVYYLTLLLILCFPSLHLSLFSQRNQIRLTPFFFLFLSLSPLDVRLKKDLHADRCFSRRLFLLPWCWLVFTVHFVWRIRVATAATLFRQAFYHFWNISSLTLRHHHHHSLHSSFFLTDSVESECCYFLRQTITCTLIPFYLSLRHFLLLVISDWIRCVFEKMTHREWEEKKNRLLILCSSFSLLQSVLYLIWLYKSRWTARRKDGKIRHSFLLFLSNKRLSC